MKSLFDYGQRKVFFVGLATGSMLTVYVVFMLGGLYLLGTALFLVAFPIIAAWAAWTG